MSEQLRVTRSPNLTSIQWPVALKAIAIALVSVVGLATLLAPWMASGTTYRSAYSLARALVAAGMLSGPWERVMYDCVVALPVLVALVCVACLFGRLRVAAALVVLENSILLALSVVAFMKLGGQTGIGPWLAGTAGTLGAVTAVLTLRMKGLLLVRRF